MRPCMKSINTDQETSGFTIDTGRLNDKILLEKNRYVFCFVKAKGQVVLFRYGK
jgi:hypothetical protein